MCQQPKPAKINLWIELCHRRMPHSLSTMAHSQWQLCANTGQSLHFWVKLIVFAISDGAAFQFPTLAPKNLSSNVMSRFHFLHISPILWKFTMTKLMIIFFRMVAILTIGCNHYSITWGNWNIWSKHSFFPTKFKLLFLLFLVNQLLDLKI